MQQKQKNKTFLRHLSIVRLGSFAPFPLSYGFEYTKILLHVKSKICLTVFSHYIHIGDASIRLYLKKFVVGTFYCKSNKKKLHLRAYIRIST